jgi:ABC-type oligopeptide transport system substrate-binding subunit
MKSIISLSAITVLAALALVGCNQNSPSNSTKTPSPNSSMNHANNMPNMNTNMPASTKTTGAANDATR